MQLVTGRLRARPGKHDGPAPSDGPERAERADHRRLLFGSKKPPQSLKRATVLMSHHAKRDSARLKSSHLPHVLRLVLVSRPHAMGPGVDLPIGSGPEGWDWGQSEVLKSSISSDIPEKVR